MMAKTRVWRRYKIKYHWLYYIIKIMIYFTNVILFVKGLQGYNTVIRGLYTVITGLLKGL